MTTRWEAERAAAVMARSRAGTSARRRAEVLARRARQESRSGAGVAESAVHEEVTPPIWRRALAGDDGGEGAARLLILVVGAAVALWIFWPGIIVGAVLYAGFYAMAPRIGRTPWWPSAVMAGVILAGGLVTGFMARPWEMRVAPQRGWPIFEVVFPLMDIPAAGLISTVLWAVVVGLLIFAFELRAWGWDAAGEVAPPEKNRDGTWREVTEKEKVRLDPMAGMDESDSPVAENTEYETGDAGNADDEKIDLAELFGANVDEPEDDPADENEEKEK